MYVENFMTWKGKCMECKTSYRSGVGLFCSNVLRLKKPSTPCYVVWCVECYHPHLGDPFQVRTSLDDRENGSEDLETEESLKKRFWIEWYMYHLMEIPFECDLCQFRSVNERDPIHRNADKPPWTTFGADRLVWFWGHFRRFRLDYFNSIKLLSIKRPVPIIGNNEVRDRFGMLCEL